MNGSKPEDGDKKPAHDVDYDQYVRSLAFDRRAKPKDRTKTEEETAKEEAEKLQEAETARLKRMRGEVDEDGSEDEEEQGRRGKRGKKSAKRAPEGDDLDDDFDEAYNGAKEFGLGGGLGDQEDKEMVNMGTDSEDEGDEEEEGDSDEETDEQDEDEDDDLDDLGDDLDDLEEDDEDVEEEMSQEASDIESDPVTTKAARKTNSSTKARPTTSTKKELPYTFKCPESMEDWVDLTQDLDDEQVETVVKRIRTLYHPSLGEGNKERLQALLGFVLTHVQGRATEPNGYRAAQLLTPHILSLVALNPLSAAEIFKGQLAEHHEIFLDDLTNATSSEETTFPDPSAMLLLRYVGMIWSTSDFSHPVTVPAALYMGQCLSQGRIHTVGDLAAGLFLSTLFLQVSRVCICVCAANKRF